MRIVYMFFLFLYILAASLHAEAEVPFKGYYRYGCWTSATPSAAGGGTILESGNNFRISGTDVLLFKPGLLPEDSFVIVRDSTIQQVIKGLRKLENNERLTLWFGYSFNENYLKLKMQGPFTYVILHRHTGSYVDILNNVDIIVIEKYPAEFYIEKTADILKKWLVSGGTAVLLSREVLALHENTVFSPFLSSPEGVKITEAIRRKWKKGGGINSSEHYVIPAGFGRIVLFPGDKPGIGVNASFKNRAAAWENIGLMSSRPLFPNEAKRKELSAGIDSILPFSRSDFSVAGKWIVIAVYVAAVLWLVFITQGKKKHLLILSASAVSTVFIIVFYSHADFVVSSLSLYEARNGSPVLREHSLLKVASFQNKNFSFSSDSGTLYFPLLPRSGCYQIDKNETVSYRIELQPFKSRILHARQIAEWDPGISWDMGNDSISLTYKEHPPRQDLFFFNEGLVYRIKGESSKQGINSYPVHELEKVDNPDKKLAGLLKAVRLLDMSGKRFILFPIEAESSITFPHGNIKRVASEGYVILAP